MGLGWIGGGLVNGFGVDWGWIETDWGGLALLPCATVGCGTGQGGAEGGLSAADGPGCVPARRIDPITKKVKPRKERDVNYYKSHTEAL